MLTTNAPKHFHIVYVSDQNWNLVKERSDSNQTSRSDALDHIIEDYAKPETDLSDLHGYEQLQAGMALIQNAINGLKPKPSVPLSKVIDLYLDEKDSKDKSSSVRIYESPVDVYIREYFDGRMVNDISRDEIIAFRDHVASVKNEQTANRVLSIVKQIFKVAVKHEYLDKNTAANVDSLRVPKSDARSTIHRALDKLMELAPFLKECAVEHLYLFICFLLETGLRCGEGAALTADDIDDKYIYVRRTLMVNRDRKLVMSDSPKTQDSVRKIPINDNIRKILDQIEMPVDGSVIFKAKRGGYIHPQVVNNTIKKVLNRLEKKGTHIDYFTCHAFRDTFATNYARAHREQGGDLHTLQKLLGHARLDITSDLYVHVLDDSLVKGMEKFALAV